MSLKKKLLIYWIGAIIIAVISSSFIASLEDSAAFIHPINIVLVVLGFFLALWFMFVVYNDAPKRGLSENWWIIVLLLGPIGGTIYYLKANKIPKGKEKKQRLKEQL